jgi:hypothetical protein
MSSSFLKKGEENVENCWENKKGKQLANRQKNDIMPGSGWRRK